MSDNVIRREVVRRDDPFGIPACFFWSVEDVVSWLETVGYGRYKKHFKSHLINGKKLQTIDACILPKMGITRFADIVDLAGLIRNLLCTGRRLNYKHPEHEAEFNNRHSYEYSPMDGLHPEYEYFMWHKQLYTPNQR